MHRSSPTPAASVRYQRLDDCTAVDRPFQPRGAPHAVGACVKAATVTCQIAGPALGRRVQQVSRDIRTPIEQAEQQKIAVVLFKEVHRL